MEIILVICEALWVYLSMEVGWGIKSYLGPSKSNSRFWVSWEESILLIKKKQNNSFFLVSLHECRKKQTPVI